LIQIQIVFLFSDTDTDVSMEIIHEQENIVLSDTDTDMDIIISENTNRPSKRQIEIEFHQDYLDELGVFDKKDNLPLDERFILCKTPDYFSKKKKFYEKKAREILFKKDKDFYLSYATSLNSYLGLKKDGNKKPKTCWKYVFSKSCKCNNSRYHPEEKERLYLKKIKSR